MSDIIDIADALIADLNASSFAMPFTAERRYQPITDLEALAELHVTVMASASEIGAGTRSEARREYRIDIGIQKRFRDGDPAELDPLMDLVEEVADHCLALRLSDPEAACTAVENDPVYVPEHYVVERTFTSVLTLTFEFWR